AARRGALTSAGAPSTMARLALAGEIDLAGRGAALHPAPGSAGKLPGRLRRLPHDRADLVERAMRPELDNLRAITCVVGPRISRPVIGDQERRVRLSW